jgi:hypothetical protein
LENWAKFNNKIWGLIPVKYELPDEEFLKVVKKAFSPLTLMSIWGMLYGGLKKSLVKKINIIFKYETLTELCMVNDDFYDCDFDDKNAEELDKSIKINSKLGNIIHKYNLNLQESIDLNKDVNKVLRKEGRWFCGLIYKLLLENGNSFVAPKMDVIVKLFEKEKKKLTKPFIQGINLSGLVLPEDVEVKELTSEYDLAYAGKTLKNCINNPGQEYKNKIARGKTKIFVITTPKSMSALELTRQNDFDWKERWTLSYCNKECNGYHRQISELILAYFHKELILSSVADKVKKWDDKIGRVQKILNPKNDTSTANNRVSHGELDGIGLFADDVPPVGPSLGDEERWGEMTIDEESFDELFERDAEDIGWSSSASTMTYPDYVIGVDPATEDNDISVLRRMMLESNHDDRRVRDRERETRIISLRDAVRRQIDDLDDEEDLPF